MKQYPEQFIVAHTDKRFEKRLVAPLVYNDKQFGTIVVPANFVSDLASIYVLRFLAPLLYAVLSGYGDRAAVIHDYLYEHHGLYGGSVSVRLGRKAADQLFFRALRAEGVALWRAYLFYYGVRAFGRWSW